VLYGGTAVALFLGQRKRPVNVPQFGAGEKAKTGEEMAFFSIQTAVP
jgi:hypothetical protein